MRKIFFAIVQIVVLVGCSQGFAAADSLERLLRSQPSIGNSKGSIRITSSSKRISRKLTAHTKSWRSPAENFQTIRNV